MKETIDFIKEKLERKYNNSTDKQKFKEEFLALISQHSDAADYSDGLQEFFDSYCNDNIHVVYDKNSIIIYLEADTIIIDKYVPVLTFKKYKNHYKLTYGYEIGHDKNRKFDNLNEIKSFAKKYFNSFQLRYIRK